MSWLKSLHDSSTSVFISMAFAFVYSLGFIYTSTHHITSKGSYTYDSITPNIQFIEVFENGELLYTEHISEVNNLIEVS